MNLKRPTPPAVFRTPGDEFAAAPDVAEWIRDTFVIGPGPLINEHHFHLQQATIGAVWTNVPATVHNMGIVGTAEFLMNVHRGRPWVKQRQQYLFRQWEVDTADFLITLFAPYLYEADDPTFCAIIEHELYHCGQALRFGFPWFTREGRPMYAIRGHDVEEFVGVVERYGAGAAAGATQAMVSAANKGPTVAAADIAAMCGTCTKKRA